MNYQKYFDYRTGAPQKQASVTRPGQKSEAATRRLGDRRDGEVYIYNEKIELAVNVAMATGRPMLIRGPSGSGKSSLARNVARRLGWRYYERVITSRTQARDLLWSFDTLRRLSDAQGSAQGQALGKVVDYVEPGVLWWAFDPGSAARRGRESAGGDAPPLEDPGDGPGDEGAVVLLDEIDKADPDVPNNLLVPLGSLQFTVSEAGVKIADVSVTRPLLLMITTNDERVLPPAFLRRCVVLELDAPDKDLLVSIAEAHYGPDVNNVYGLIAEKVIEMSPKAAAGAAARAREGGPSTAEFLDTVRACTDLGVTPASDIDAWKAIFEATLLKRSEQTGLS